MNIENLSPEQKYALHKFKLGENLFITGPGGTGKTTLIRHLIDSAKEDKKNVQVCALTGCAAVLLNCGARTIHSWSGIKLARGEPKNIIDTVLRSKRLLKNWKSTKVLIVDEVSMMSKKIFNILNEIGKRARLSQLPFGGIQVIYTGDFFQLPPVGNNMDDPGTEDFCFESEEWNHVFKKENHIELTTIFRQRDLDYIEVLNEIRRGDLSEKNSKLLETYVGREYVNTENTRFIPTKIFPTRVKADYVNTMMFKRLDEDEYHFEFTIKTDCKTMLDSGKLFTPEQTIKCERMTQQEGEYELENLKNNTSCEQLLKLKKGANVLCRVNIDIESGICNGSQGIITRIEERGNAAIIEVKFTNGLTRIIEPHWWQSEEFPCIAIRQYPLSLSWAMTIHKIQGATLAMAEMDIGNAIFEYGQTYVALSRIQSLNGLYLSAFNPKKIRSNPKVIEFYNNIPKIDRLALETVEKADNIFEKFECKEEEYVEDPTIKRVRL
jgi:ATP-dependent DNA helicase PIF1